MVNHIVDNNVKQKKELQKTYARWKLCMPLDVAMAFLNRGVNAKVFLVLVNEEADRTLSHSSLETNSFNIAITR